MYSAQPKKKMKVLLEKKLIAKKEQVLFQFRLRMMLEDHEIFHYKIIASF